MTPLSRAVAGGVVTLQGTSEKAAGCWCVLTYCVVFINNEMTIDIQELEEAVQLSRVKGAQARLTATVNP